MEKTIYLHIGMPKTGTSSLQLFLQKNKEILENNGYCYPDIPIHYSGISKMRNAHFLVGSSFGEIDEKDVEKIRSQRKQGFDFVKEQMEKYPRLILSDEGIWNSLGNSKKDALKEMWDFCNTYSYRLQVIVYLRSQDSFLESYWKQRIRRRGATWKWKDFLGHVPSYVVLDYDSHLQRIANVIGKENIIVRRYEKESFSGKEGTIYSDFLEVIGLESGEEFLQLEKPANVSLSNNFAEIKRILNKLKFYDEEPGENQIAWFEEVIMECSRQQETPYDSAMFSPQERKKFMERYEKSNQKVAQEYFGEEQLFQEDTSHLPKWSRSNDAQYEDTLLFLGTVLWKQQSEIAKLKNEMETARGGIFSRVKNRIDNITIMSYPKGK
jgi:hypothetical protein